jgi:acyl-CoA synthetase (NDP forming)
MLNREDLFKTLDRMFFPRSVAVVGASDVPGKWGNNIMIALLGWSYKGKVFPVNPKKKEIMGLKCYPSLQAIPDEVDLAVFTVPARSVAGGFRDCIEKNVHAAVVMSAGFRETGPEGAALERELVETAERGNIVFIGPNTMGIVSSHCYFEAVPLPTAPRPGGLAIISQSGNIGIQLMKWTEHKDIGLSIYAGMGNEAMLRSSDILAYLGTKDVVKAIAMYIEGIPDGQRFMDDALEVTRKKPVIALKAGKTAAGSQAAMSHTGSLAGSYEVYKAMFAQTGIVNVETPSELLNVSAAMTHLPIPGSNRVGVMSFGGGWGVITADLCEHAGLVLPALTPGIVQDLDRHLPAFWNRRNPVDLVAEDTPEMCLHVIETLARWEETDAVLALGIVGRSRFVEDFIASQERFDGKLLSRELKLAVLKDQIRSEDRIVTGIGKIQKETGKPILVVALTEGGMIMRYTDSGVVILLSTPEEAVSILSHMTGYGRFLSGHRA